MNEKDKENEIIESSLDILEKDNSDDVENFEYINASYIDVQ